MRSELVRAGKYDVLAAGTVLSYPGSPIEIVIQPDTPEPFTIEFVFIQKSLSAKEDGKIEFEQVSPTHLKITLTNINNPLGGGTPAPELIAESKNAKMYLHFRASGNIDGDLHELTYTVFTLNQKRVKSANKKPKPTK